MYTVLRKVHLYSAFVIAAFLLMYFVTGGVMVMESLFPRSSKKTIIETIAVDRKTPEQKVVEDLNTAYNIHGQLRTRIPEKDKVVYTFTRPGYKAELSRVHPDSIRVTISEGTFGSVMNDFHRVRGYEGNLVHIVWAFLYDLSCISLLVFAFTGVYLWWKLEKKKVTGIIFLLTSTGITAFTIAYLYRIG